MPSHLAYICKYTYQKNKYNTSLSKKGNREITTKQKMLMSPIVNSDTNKDILKTRKKLTHVYTIFRNDYLCDGPNSSFLNSLNHEIELQSQLILISYKNKL